MLLFGYLLAMLLLLLPLVYFTEKGNDIKKKNSLFTTLKVGLTNVMLTLTFMSYQHNRLVLRTD